MALRDGQRRISSPDTLPCLENAMQAITAKVTSGRGNMTARGTGLRTVLVFELCWSSNYPGFTGAKSLRSVAFTPCHANVGSHLTFNFWEFKLLPRPRGHRAETNSPPESGWRRLASRSRGLICTSAPVHQCHLFLLKGNHRWLESC